MNDLGQKILAEIKEKKISPIPRWAFLVRNILLCFFYLIFLVIGGLASGVIIFLVKNNDWDLYSQLYSGVFQFILLTAPYFWFIALAVLALVAEYDFKHIKGSYHYHTYLIALASLIVSLFLGAFFYHYGLEQVMHNIFVNDVPFYSNLIQPKEEAWTQPENGVLAGTVITATAEGNFLLKDFSGGAWNISILNAHIRGGVTLMVGDRVKVIGRQTAEGQFAAQEIRPWIRACSACGQAIQEIIH